MRLTLLKKSFSRPAVLLIAVVVLWLVARTAFRAFWLVGVVLLLVGTYLLVRPEFRAAFGATGDRRPWLVRLREHRWERVSVPFVGSVPRSWAYLAVVVGWWWFVG